jgi:hypothetical protein
MIGELARMDGGGVDFSKSNPLGDRPSDLFCDRVQKLSTSEFYRVMPDLPEREYNHGIAVSLPVSLFCRTVEHFCFLILFG